VIRDARYSDIQDIVRMGQSFHEAAKLEDIAAFDPESFAEAVTNLIESPDGLLMVIDDDGAAAAMAGALLYPLYFNKRCRMAQEIFWWANPEARGQVALDLRRAVEARARAAGAQRMIWLALEGMKPEAMTRLYRREGYRPVERNFIKEL